MCSALLRVMACFNAVQGRILNLSNVMLSLSESSFGLIIIEVSGVVVKS